MARNGSSKLVGFSAVTLALGAAVALPMTAHSAPAKGHVTVDPAGGQVRVAIVKSQGQSFIDCGYNGGVTCEGDFRIGSAIQLTVTDGRFFTFAGWAGDCAAAGRSTTCTLAIDGDKSVIATATTTY